MEMEQQVIELDAFDIEIIRSIHQARSLGIDPGPGTVVDPLSESLVARARALAHCYTHNELIAVAMTCKPQLNNVETQTEPGLVPLAINPPSSSAREMSEESTPRFDDASSVEKQLNKALPPGSPGSKLPKKTSSLKSIAEIG